MNKLNILNAIGELLLADTAESKRLARELVGFLRQQEACDMVATVETEITSRQEPIPSPLYKVGDQVRVKLWGMGVGEIKRVPTVDDSAYLIECDGVQRFANESYIEPVALGYRDVTRGDIGKRVEVRHSDNDLWATYVLVYIEDPSYHPLGKQRYITESASTPGMGLAYWTQARIRVDS